MNETTFTSYSDKIPSLLKDFTPFAKVSDRKAWDGMNGELKNYILEQAELAATKIRSEGWPLLPISLWHDFYKNGNRVNFENNHFNRRTLLIILVLAECIENKGRYLELITDGIFLICEESAWHLPAHNSYTRDTPQLPYPDASRPIFELFAGETANLLSLTWYLLKEKLDGDSPMICQRIEQELERRIITPYLNEHFWWMGDGDEPMCNWTPWCTQNALLAAFILPHSNEIRTAVLKKAFYSMDCFLKDYGEDGCCSEGAEYYRHAGLTFYNAADIISRVSGGLTDDIYKLSKIKNIAEYILNMNIPHSEYFFNFADCSPKAGKSGAREYLFGKAVNSSALTSFAAEQWKASSVKEKLFDLAANKLSQSNLYYTLQSLFADKEINSATVCHSKEDSFNKNIWYQSIGVFIVHKGIYSTASKAGNNADSHNHNDTGSFIVYKNGKPFIIDVGVENYTQKTFSPQRYEIWTMQSSYHNLAEINGAMEHDGKEYAASDVKIDGDSISMDIAKAYTKDAGLTSYLRKISTSESAVVIEDSFAFKNKNKSSIVMNLMLKDQAVYDANTSTIKVADEGSIKIDCDSSVMVESEAIEVTDSRLRRTWPETIYRLQIKTSDASRLTLTIK
ncbi:heparinase II/III family protein [Treponema sp.]|uniref:heparinase II/III domain-containing protein n=1 Tax=Treponema sp. TaxID=166 RepID=UPI0025D0DD8D|nr:heparinase II/III family protein [Treponema sp.]MCR5217703.1 heparinase II/III-family protein [Treponema sp.]